MSVPPGPLIPSDANLSALVVNGNINAEGDISSQNPFIRVALKDSAQTITTATKTTVLYDTVQENQGGMTYDSTTGFVTVPTAGIYTVTVTSSFATNATGQRHLYLYDGSGLETTTVMEAVSSGSSIPSHNSLYKLSAGDTLYSQVQQTSGGDLDIGTVFTVLDVAKLG